MKKVFLLLAIFYQLSSFSQNKEVLYNFTSIPQSSLVNPGADVSYKFYFGVPVASGVSANLGSSSFSAYDLFAENGVDFNDKVRNVVNKSSNKDRVITNQQLELFSGGFRIGGRDSKSYISFGMYQEFDFFMFMPKDLAVLALDGNKNHIGKSFNLGDLSLKAEVLSVFHVGFHKKVSEKLVLGGRAKIYSSGANATSTKNSGYIYTGQNVGTPNLYSQTISSDLELKTSGISKFTKDEYEGNIARDIANNTFFNGSLGLGFDAGITYYFKDNLQFTASVIDLGFIRQSKDIETLTYKGTYQYDGVNPNFLGNDDPENVFDEFNAAIPRDTLYNKYTTWRPTKIYSSLQYSFGEYRSDEDCNCRTQVKRRYLNDAGVQFFAMSAPRTPLFALTAFYKRSIFEKLDVKATYTFDTFSNKNIGLGLSGTLWKVNMYLLVNNILELKDVSKANSMAFQVGLNFVFQDKE
ncbi:DUF5723 family protein [Flavobacterium reichenbachii]|uniref:DUF5723 domain-containing protein n=1 Tax=Flavobacterium reichenbachii TaxID=362418 RepID=A0A085ZP31_9FLAO|nr:DUF5723 family protein [Flavobacterium reichenbachii]KFF06195.1 hypothetical protein IW19_11930 [Flavobacterium reichenbachii]OXB17582.1 hypothetical protein B0A68_04640 [Flavobacterium reichenbachii]